MLENRDRQTNPTMSEMPGELAKDPGLSVEEEIVRVKKNVLDRLQQEISTRLLRLKDQT